MILLYHKVDVHAPTAFWVSADRFYQQMSELRSYDVVTLDNYDPHNPRHVVITFDGIYENVIEFAVPILEHFGYPFELFVIGDYLGLGNEFDQKVEPPARFASVEQLQWAAKHGGRIQWHSKSHQKMAGLSTSDLDAELTVPSSVRESFGSEHFDWFAFPHGEHDPAIMDAVKARYGGALSCVAGNDTDRYSLNRLTVKEATTWRRPTVAIIIPNYNYGQYLPEAIESVLNQTIPADEVLVIDDGSDDGSKEILDLFADKVRIEINQTNLGIVENFRKAVALTSSDYIAFIGADNRIRSDFVEKCRAALDSNDNAAVAYTDLIMFGPRAQMMSDRKNVSEIARSMAERWPLLLRRYPDPTSDVLAQFQKSNFVHGSSMYRRRDYEAAGGYCGSEQAEDHNLFYRMFKLGRDFIHVSEPVLEYRQHSSKQANTVLGLENQSRLLRKRAKTLQAERDEARKQLKQANRRLKSASGRALAQQSGKAEHAPEPLADMGGDERGATGECSPSAITKLARRIAGVLRHLKRQIRPAQLSDLEVVVVHYRHIRPTVAMLNAFFRHYPEQPVTLVDNSGGACRVNTDVLPHLGAHKKNIRVIVNPAADHGPMGGLSHGGGLDFAVSNVSRSYIVSMETDTFVLERGGLEYLLNLANQGYDWAGSAQKPYNDKFASFSPSFAMFRVAPIRRHRLTFRRKNRTARHVFKHDLLISHHLEAAERLRAGKPLSYPQGKPPDTYRRPIAEIIAAELKHLSYFDTGELAHCALTNQGYRGKLFEPIASVCHTWGSRDEAVFEENFWRNLPHLELNDFLPKALQKNVYGRCALPGISVQLGDGPNYWRPVGDKKIETELSEYGLHIRIPVQHDRLYVGLEGKSFDKPPGDGIGAALAPAKNYQLRCKSRLDGAALSGQLWLIEYGDGRRLKNHHTPLNGAHTRLCFKSAEGATHFRVFWRFSGEGAALIEDIGLWMEEGV